MEAVDNIGDAIGIASPTIRAVIIRLRHFLSEALILNLAMKLFESSEL
jgi:hypothetical protein